MPTLDVNSLASITVLDRETFKPATLPGLRPDLLAALEALRLQIPGADHGAVALSRERLEARLAGLSATYASTATEVLERLPWHRALVRRIPDSSDFTFFLDRPPAVRSTTDPDPGDPLEAVLERPIEGALDDELWLWDDQAQRAAHGRALACSCGKGSQWSVTFRRQHEYPPLAATAAFYNKLGEITSLLASTIFAVGRRDAHGLIVIAGRTNSAKSQIARKLIERYLDPRRGSPADRRPHLVTFEDPIEELLVGLVPQADCTQREKPTDVASLLAAANDALRQTPAILFVGETRARADWNHLLEFAGTGHLVLTTTHAGSLVEAVGKILEETESNTPATRSIVADRLLAVVHLKSGRTEAGTPFLVPAIWHRTPLGIKALMAEGLSSLLPNTPRQGPAAGGGEPHLPGSIGRYWCARQLAQDSTAREVEGREPGAARNVMRKAIEWDLEGV